MESDFILAFENYFKDKRNVLRKEQVEASERFALSNQERARGFIEYLRTSLDYEFKGRWILDIGSAYGGFVIS